MKISALHLCTSDSWGGLELYACTIMAELKKAGCHVLAVCRPQSKVESFLHDQGIQCAYLPSNKPVSLSSIRVLQTIIRQHQITVVHVHFHKDIWPASLALRNDHHTKLFFSLYMGVASKDDFWHRYIFKRVDGFFTSSKTWTNSLPRLFAVPREIAHLLPYGRKLERFAIDTEKRQALRSRYGIQPDELLVGTMVRIDPAKGVIDFVESFLLLNEALRSKVKYLIVGEPTRKAQKDVRESPFELRSEEYYKDIRKYIARNALERTIILAGYQDDTIGYLSAMDVFVFPSRNEMFSLVMLDAMGMGLPIVASGEGGTFEQVQDNINGILYKSADPQDLAYKLTSVLLDDQTKRRLGVSARQFVEQNHDMKITIDRLIGFYQQEKSDGIQNVLKERP
jgi:glycosyltransferase involved in cell wall biosynthesis